MPSPPCHLAAVPGDTRTHLARIAKRRKREGGDLTKMRRTLWRAVEAAEASLLDAAAAEDAAAVLKAVHAITQASGAFARLVEVGELEARLAELESALAARADGPAIRPGGAVA